MSEGLEKLEIRIAYQDRHISELDEVVRAFATRVEALERELVQLKATMADRPEAIGPADEPPPHY